MPTLRHRHLHEHNVVYSITLPEEKLPIQAIRGVLRVTDAQYEKLKALHPDGDVPWDVIDETEGAAIVNDAIAQGGQYDTEGMRREQARRTPNLPT